MKLRFSLDYLVRKYKNMAGVVDWANKKALEMQAKHNVCFDHGRGVAGVYQFTPYFDEHTPAVSDPEILVMLLKITKNPRYTTNFILLAKETGLSLEKVVGACKFLVSRQNALAGKNAAGHCSSIRWYPVHCKVYEGMREEKDHWALMEQTRLVRGISSRNLGKA